MVLRDEAAERRLRGERSVPGRGKTGPVPRLKHLSLDHDPTG